MLILLAILSSVVGWYVGHKLPTIMPKYPAGTLVRCSFGDDEDQWDAFYVGRAAFWFHHVEVARDPMHWWEAARLGSVVPVKGKNMEPQS